MITSCFNDNDLVSSILIEEKNIHTKKKETCKHSVSIPDIVQVEGAREVQGQVFLQTVYTITE